MSARASVSWSVWTAIRSACFAAASGSTARMNSNPRLWSGAIRASADADRGAETVRRGVGPVTACGLMVRVMAQDADRICAEKRSREGAFPAHVVSGAAAERFF